MFGKTNNSLQYYTLFSFYVVVIVIVAFLIFPRVFSSLSTFKRSAELSNFERDSGTSHKVDAQKYWTFREFYNEGSFLFNKDGVDTNELNKTLSEMNVPIKKSALTMPFLIYKSKYFLNIDSLTTYTSVSQIFNMNDADIQTLGKNYLLVKKNAVTYLIFILPVKEMEKANGFLDSNDEKTKAELKNKYWLNISMITL